MKIAILPNIRRDADLSVTRAIADRAAAFNAQILVLPEFDGIRGAVCCPDEKTMMKNADMLITVGGDGTIIHAAVSASEYGLPILGVNCGNIGFIAELEVNEISRIDAVFRGEYTVEERLMIDVRVNGQTVSCFNDAVITHGNVARITELSLYNGGRPVDSYRADGLIVATPTGSTAYNLSAGGPIVEPTMRCMIVTPICPHTLASRSLVFSADKPTEIKCGSDGSFLTIDGQSSIPLSKDQTVSFTVSDKKVRLIKLKDRSFFDILNQKLSGRNNRYLPERTE